jgi:hypothetical protein
MMREHSMIMVVEKPDAVDAKSRSSKSVVEVGVRRKRRADRRPGVKNEKKKSRCPAPANGEWRCISVPLDKRSEE